MKKIIIVGGGTAGWLTALYIHYVTSNIEISVIESKEIGILGAGEGSTPHLIGLLDAIGIPVSDLVKNCDATIKNGIKFTNWNNDSNHYFHPFGPLGPLSFNPLNMNKKILSQSPMILSAINKNQNLKEADFLWQISEKNLVPFIYNQKSDIDPIADYNGVSNFSIHFNASKFANRLKEIGISRGIKSIEQTIVKTVLSEEKNITGFILDNTKKINCDFVFDCSGFHRMLIGNLYNSEWKSYSDKLPVDSAIPFFIDMDEEIPPYTEAIAMKYGWIWKIPLQNRYGCGYVYDSSLISEEQAVQEIESYLGLEPTYPRKDKGGFKFNAGYYKEPWINNCIAIGLSSGFIEPLEATSIWSSIICLDKILSGREWITNNTPLYRKEYNKFFEKVNSGISDFIYFHYMSNRSDTEFWKKFTYENAPETLKEILDMLTYRLPNMQDDNPITWGHESWISVANGIGKINKDLVSNNIEFSIGYQHAISQYENFASIIKQTTDLCEMHKNFLESLK